MNLTDLLQGAAAKYLSGVDVVSNLSNQHEIGGLVRSGFKPFLEGSAEHSVTMSYITDEEEPVTVADKLTWYDTREKKPKRGAEYRLYYKDNAVTELMNPESRKRALDILNRELERDKEDGIDPDRSITMEMEYYHKDGSTIWLENVVRGIRDETGDVIGLHGVSRDITERKRAEQELIKSEAKYRFLTEKMNDMMITTSSISIPPEQSTSPASAGTGSGPPEKMNEIKATASSISTPPD